MAEKKVGILTFHYSTNYGAVLQCYALLSYLTSLGVCAEVIDYVPATYNACSSRISLRTLLKCGSVPRMLRYGKSIGVKKRYCSDAFTAFEVFRKSHMKLSRRVDDVSIESLLKEYDAIFVGSDQVWSNAQRDKGVYFLNFPEYTGLRFAYAVDSNNDTIVPDLHERLSGALSAFQRISVRNRYTHSFVKQLIGIDAPIVSDPTQFMPACTEKENVAPYILVYVLGKEISGGNKAAIKALQKYYGNIPVKSIVIPQMQFEVPEYTDEVYYTLSPMEWLAMVNNAAVLYTDSFHGIVFALKNHVPFVGYWAESSRSGRLLEIQSRWKLGRHIISSAAEINADMLSLKDNYAEIEAIQKKEADISAGFIKDCLSML